MKYKNIENQQLKKTLARILKKLSLYLNIQGYFKFKNIENL